MNIYMKFLYYKFYKWAQYNKSIASYDFIACFLLSIALFLNICSLVSLTGLLIMPNLLIKLNIYIILSFFIVPLLVVYYYFQIKLDYKDIIN